MLDFNYKFRIEDSGSRNASAQNNQGCYKKGQDGKCSNKRRVGNKAATVGC